MKILTFTFFMLFFSSGQVLGQVKALDSLLNCLKQAKVAKPIKKINGFSGEKALEATTNIGKYIFRYGDKKIDQTIFGTNLFVRSLGQVAFGGQKSAVAIADFLDMGLQSKTLSQAFVRKYLNFLAASNKALGKNAAADSLIDFFKTVEGNLNFTPKGSNTFASIAENFKKLPFNNLDIKKHLLNSLENRLSLNYNSYKSVLASIKAQNLKFKSTDEIDEFMRFILHIDSYTQPTKDILLRQSAGYISKRRQNSLVELLPDQSLWGSLKTNISSYFFGKSDLDGALLSFHQKEIVRREFQAKHFEEIKGLYKSDDVAKIKAKQNAELYSNLRYTCKARGKSALRSSSANSFKKYAFATAVLSDSLVYTFNGGFQQNNGRNIFIHNTLNTALLEYTSPKILIGRNYSNFQRALYSYFARLVSMLIDKKSYEYFIEGGGKTPNLDYQNIIGETQIIDAVNQSIKQLDKDPNIKRYISEFNKIPEKEINKETILEFIKGQDLSTQTPEEEEQELLNIIAANLVKHREYAKINDDKLISTGSLSEDRALYLTGYRAFSSIKSLLVSQLVYTSLCGGYRFAGKTWGGKFNPAQAKAISGSVFLVNIIGSTLAFRLGLEHFTGQK